MAIAFGRVRPGFAVRRHHSPTRANRGPGSDASQQRRRKGRERSSAERTGSDGDEDHENGALGVAIADRGRDGGEPFIRIAKPLVLDDLLVVERRADDESAQEGHCSTQPSVSIRSREQLGMPGSRTGGEYRVRPADPLAAERQHDAGALVLVSGRHFVARPRALQSSARSTKKLLNYRAGERLYAAGHANRLVGQKRKKKGKKIKTTKAGRKSVEKKS